MKKAIFGFLLCAVLLAGCGGTCSHKNTQLMDAKPATCLEDGATGALVCENCKQILTPSTPIPALGHDKVLEGWVEATCTAPGNSGTQVCSRCGEVFGEAAEIPALGHVEIQKNERPATCTEEGYSGDGVCKYCGITLQEGRNLPATGHGSKVLKNAVAATANADGYSGDTYCADCGGLLASGKTIPKTTAASTPRQEENTPKNTTPQNPSPEAAEPETDDPVVYVPGAITEEPTAPEPAPVSGSSAAQTLFNQMNASRAASGLAPLAWDNSLVSACSIRAQEHADNYAAGMTREAHTRPDGRAFGTVLSDIGFRTDWNDCGENLALATSVDLIHQAWMDSPSHRGAILDSSYTHAAIAVVNQNGYYFACCLFWC